MIYFGYTPIRFPIYKSINHILFYIQESLEFHLSSNTSDGEVFFELGTALVILDNRVDHGVDSPIGLISSDLSIYILVLSFTAFQMVDTQLAIILRKSCIEVCFDDI